MPEQQTKALQWPATCYYVQDENGRWGYFTVIENMGLLQAYTDYGNYSHRWGAPGPDFKAFLMRAGADYLTGCLESTVAMTVPVDTQKKLNLLQSRLRSLTKYLWPLFIEQLKAERAAKTAPQEATA